MNAVLSLTLIVGLITTWYYASDNENVLTPSFLFIVSYTLVCFPVPLLIMMESGPVDLISRWMPYPENAAWTVNVALIGLACFISANILFIPNEEIPNHNDHNSSLYFTLRDIAFVRMCLECISWISLLAFAILGGEAIAQGAYAQTVPGSAMAAYLVFETSIFALISVEGTRIALANSDKIGLMAYVLTFSRRTMILLAMSCAVFFVLGDRGAILAPVLAFIAPFALCQRGLRPMPVMLILVLGFALMQMMAIGRSRDGGFDFYRVIQAVNGENDSLLVSSMFEFSGCYRSLNAASEPVALLNNHIPGQFQCGQLLTVLPVGGESFLYPLLGVTAADMDSAAAITRFLNLGYGSGTTVVGELYLDFGMAGVVGGLFLFGILCRHVERQCRYRVNIFWVLLGCILMYKMLYLPRSQALIGIRTFVWAWLMISFLISVSRLNIYTPNMFPKQRPL